MSLCFPAYLIKQHLTDSDLYSCNTLLPPETVCGIHGLNEGSFCCNNQPTYPFPYLTLLLPSTLLARKAPLSWSLSFSLYLHCPLDCCSLCTAPLPPESGCDTQELNEGNRLEVLFKSY